MTTAAFTQTGRRAGRAFALTAFFWSLLAIPIGLWQLLDPEGGPFTSHLYEPTITLPGPDWVGPAALVGAGVLGLFTARAAPRLWALPALFAAVFGLLVTTSSPIALAGYVCAFFIPPLIAAAPVLLARGAAARTVAAVAVAGALVALGLGGVVDYAAVGAFLAGLGRGLAEIGWYAAVQVWVVVGAGIWTALALSLVLRGRPDRPAPAWLAPERAARWGRTASWIAFACALPYGLTRMTWLTPWAWAGGPIGADLPMETRVWGLCLGFAALGGGLLCLGMTYRWGTVWPKWVPVVKGRPVPPMVAIVPATAVAGLFTFVSVPFVALAVRQGATELVWAFPFYFWGPALGAAALAYAIRRGVVAAR